MTPEAMADLHAACFPDRPWSAAEFRELLGLPTTQVFSEEAGFILLRVIAPEAEVLTLAVDPLRQRQGIGRHLLTRTQRGLEGVTELFLEVAADNAAAMGLYKEAGFTEVGRRAGYYARAERAVDAVLMRLHLE